MRKWTLMLAVIALVVSVGGLSGCKKRTPELELEPTPVPAQKDVPEPTPVPTTEWERRGITEEAWREEQQQQEQENVLQDIRFDFDRWELSYSARQTLARVGDYLLGSDGLRLLIEGHCDTRGSESYNLALGEKRAAAAKKYLVSYGVDADRLRTVSYGEERPMDPRSTEDAWSKNRRDHFSILD